MKFSELELGQMFRSSWSRLVYVRENGPNGKNARLMWTRTYVLFLDGDEAEIAE